jgi:hypothetical protein
VLQKRKEGQISFGRNVRTVNQRFAGEWLKRRAAGTVWRR